MSDETLEGWLFFIFWMVPNIVVAALAWIATEAPRNRGWEATKAFFGMAALVMLFGLPHTFFWMLVFGSPFVFVFDKIDRHFGGDGVEGMPWSP